MKPAHWFVLPAALLWLAACGDSQASIAGTYTLDKPALEAEMQKQMKRVGQAWLDEGLDHDVRIRIGIHQE